MREVPDTCQTSGTSYFATFAKPLAAMAGSVVSGGRLRAQAAAAINPVGQHGHGGRTGISHGADNGKIEGR
jgi:hypothetical protein